MSEELHYWAGTTVLRSEPCPWNHAYLPPDTTFDPEREILKVGETEFSLAFLRFFGKHNDGAIFKIVYTEQGIRIERVEP